MSFLRFLISRHPYLAAALALSLMAAGWFGFKAGSEALYFANPSHQSQDLALWMTPRYVAKSWDLPPEVVIPLMELDPDHKQKTLADVIAKLGITLPELQKRVAEAKARLRAEGARHGAGHGGDKARGSQP